MIAAGQGDSYRRRFLDVGMAPERGHYAEHTAQLIDSEVKRILTEANDTARRVLSEVDGLRRLTHGMIEGLEADVAPLQDARFAVRVQDHGRVHPGRPHLVLLPVRPQVVQLALGPIVSQRQ